MRKIGSDLVGLQFEPVKFEWDANKVILYALGVGAKPEGELEYVFEGKGPKVLPTFAVIPGMLSMGGLISNVEINLAMLLHGEQGITLYREIPPDAKVNVVGKVTAVWDKGKAAVIETEGVVEDSKGPMLSTTATLFIRGAGGFGGERGPSAVSEEIPQRAPDHVVEDHVQPEQGVQAPGHGSSRSRWRRPGWTGRRRRGPGSGRGTGRGGTGSAHAGSRPGGRSALRGLAGSRERGIGGVDLGHPARRAAGRLGVVADQVRVVLAGERSPGGLDGAGGGAGLDTEHDVG